MIKPLCIVWHLAQFSVISMKPCKLVVSQFLEVYLNLLVICINIANNILGKSYKRL